MNIFTDDINKTACPACKKEICISGIRCFFSKHKLKSEYVSLFRNKTYCPHCGVELIFNQTAGLAILLGMMGMFFSQSMFMLERMSSEVQAIVFILSILIVLLGYTLFSVSCKK